MKTPRLLSFVVPILLATTFAASAEPVIPVDEMPALHPHSLFAAIGNVLIFAFIGIAAAIIGYKLFDKCTPGDLHKEIIEHRNVAAAIVAAAVIIGVSIIIAASMIG